MEHCQQEYCSICHGTGRVMKNSSSTLITAKQTLVTCLNCKGTGIVEMWHVPGINKVWPKQPSEEEIQIQSIKEAEEADRLIQNQLKFVLKRHEERAKMPAKIFLRKLLPYVLLSPLYGFGSGLLIGLGGCILGNSWHSFQVSILFGVILGFLLGLIWGINQILENHNARKSKLYNFKKKHNLE
ncbi:MAG: zinc finger-like domain-containing protein [Haliscomenobacter sp.]|nr:zinc finger-like domain-containing protein [Haliscomenobacter sp.]